MTKKIHIINHVDFESAGYISDWIAENDLILSETNIYNNDNFPDLADFDCLVSMGGPMSAALDDDKYPWFADEINFIKKAIYAEKKVLGICLGAQFIARALGAKVKVNQHKEIGWHNINFSPEILQTKFFSGFPTVFEAFHWHGDTFELPKDSIRIASSEGCANQGFIYGENVAGFQCHFEFTEKSLNRLIYKASKELVKSDYVMTKNEILNKIEMLKRNNELLKVFLDRFILGKF